MPQVRNANGVPLYVKDERDRPMIDRSIRISNYPTRTAINQGLTRASYTTQEQYLNAIPSFERLEHKQHVLESLPERSLQLLDWSISLGADRTLRHITLDEVRAPMDRTGVLTYHI